jgi:hypothetical protein
MADPITTLPTPPSRQSPSDFSAKADALLGALPTFVSEVNAVAVAMNLNATSATSVTELTIGTGSQSLTVDAAKSFLPGMSVKIARTAAPSNWMHGDVTSYNSGTGALVVNVLQTQGSGTFTDWTITFSAPIRPWEMVSNLKIVVNAAANKLDIFTMSGGAAPDASNLVSIGIPDGNGIAVRQRAAAYLSGTSQIVLADAANYWNKGSLDAEIKTAWLYAIWDGTGIVWALAGYSGFTVVPTTTTPGDDDYFLLEDGSTYARDAGQYCVAVAKIRYQYDTADNPDHTIQATGENAPQVIWNPKSDYARRIVLASNVVSAGNIATASQVSCVAKQSGKYEITAQVQGVTGAGATYGYVSGDIRVGSATYGSAVTKGSMAVPTVTAATQYCVGYAQALCFANAGDTIHLGIGMVADAGNRTIIGNSTGSTSFQFRRTD